MTLATRTPRISPTSDAIRAGIVDIVRDRATVGATVFAPDPSWCPVRDGAAGLARLTVAKVEASYVTATDSSGATWVIWR